MYLGLLNILDVWFPETIMKEYHVDKIVFSEMIIFAITGLSHGIHLKNSIHFLISINW